MEPISTLAASSFGLLAYVDPGTGYALWMALAAMGTGLLFQMRRIKRKIASLFTRKDDS